MVPLKTNHVGAIEYSGINGLYLIIEGKYQFIIQIELLFSF